LTDYYLSGVPEDHWRDFKALATLEGMTAREKLLKYVASEVRFFRAAKFNEKTLKMLRRRGEESWRKVI
jgi:hypothetical protein